MPADKQIHGASAANLRGCAATWVKLLLWLTVASSGAGEPTPLEAADCIYSITPTSRLHDYPAEDAIIAVTAPPGCAWTVVNSNRWISIRFTTNGVGSGNVRYSVFANVDPLPRSGVITVAGQIYTVDQLPAPCTYSILPTNELFGVQGDSAQVRIYTAAACPWTLSNTNNWITIVSPTNGVGGTAIDYQFATSYQRADRSGVVAVAGNFLTVRQLGNPCSYTVTASPLTFAYGLGTGSGSITTGSACPWDVINTNAWWVLSAPTQGIGSWSLPFTVLPNPSSIARAGVVNIAGHPFTFSQAGAPCSYSISPAGRTHGYLAETGLVMVTAVDGCSWTIQNTNNWIALTSSPNAPGSGTVGYQVSANPGPPRSGTLVIAGNPFVVLQTAAIAPAIIANPPSQNVAAGTTVSLKVSAMGSPPLAYQWRFNGANLTDGGNITGSASPTLVISGVQGSQAGAYAVVVNNVRGAAISTPPALLVVNTPPSLRPIAIKTVCPGAPLVFRAFAIDGDFPAQTLTYRLGAGAPSGSSLDPSTGLFVWPSASGEGPRQLIIQVTDTGSPPLTSAQAVTINVVPGFSTNVPLVPTGSIWSYRDTGEDLGTAWTAPGFDDGPWKRGPAKFGYGNGNEATIVSYGTNVSAKYVTTYFRQAFNFGDIFTTGALRVRAVRDAGLVLYLNGSELYRDNMPAGPVTALTLASSNVLASDRSIYFPSPLLDPGGLLPGRNVLAVELHRQSASGSTLGFDLELSASESFGSPVIVAQPQSQSIPAGASASLSVKAVGAPPLRLQWYFNGAPLPNATNSTLSVANAVSAQSGAYFAILSNYLGSASSDVIALTVVPNAAPVLGPIGDQTILLGSSLALSASAADADFPPQRLAFSLDPGAPPGAAIQPATGLFTWTPTAQDPGASSVTVRVTDSGFPPLSAAQSFTITVLAPNVAPVLAPIGNKVLVSGGSLSFTISATDANGPTQTLGYSLDAAPAGASLNPYTGLFTWTPPAAQSPVASSVTVRVTDNGSPPLSDTKTFTISVIPPVTGVTTNVTLVPAGSVWKYLDTGQDLGTAWAGLAYNDSAWPSGPAILGYGGGSEATVVGYGPNASAKYITTYFRRSFTVAAPSTFKTLNTQVRRDDGVVAYINGTEVFRDNMPAGPINYLTLSPLGVSGTNKTSYHPSPAFAPTMLVPGNNVIAAEVHQHSASSSSMDFDLVLSGMRIGGNNTAPVLAPIANQTVLAGSQLIVPVSAADADSPAQSLTFTLDPGAPAGATINPATGFFAWTPAPASGPGTVSVTVRVTDNGSPSLSSSQSFTIAILVPNVPNAAPVLAPIGNKTVASSASLSFTVSATDADLPAQSLTYTLDAAPAGASINPATGLFFWTPTAAQAPSANGVTVRVTDNNSPALSASQTFIITVLAPNVAPVLAAVGNKTVVGGEHLSFSVLATDANVPARILTYSLDAAPPGASLDPATGQFAWTPPAPAAQVPSTNSFTVRVTENGPPPLSAFQNFSITVVPPNVAPVLAPIANKTVVIGTLLSFTISATDSNVPAQTLTYGLDAAPPGASLNPATGLFTWTPAATAGPGANNVTIHVTDNGSPPLSAFQSFTITVLASNTPPVLGPIGNKVVVGGTLLSFTVSATDASAPGQTLTYSLDAAPAGASLNPFTGGFAWTPPAALGSSTNRVTLRVTDNGSPPLSDTRTFTITVIPPASGVTTNVTLVPAGSVWKYLDTGQDLGTAWAGLAYNDSAWPSGPALLGYGGGSEATVVGYGPNASAKYITTYFRRSFTVAAPSTFNTLSTQVRRDDGVVVYINGTEVFRDNMPAGPINYLTPAPLSVSGTDKTSYHPSPAFAPTMLVPGNNVIAAEVHQHSGSSSSMDFDLLLSGMMIGGQNTAPVLAPIPNQTVLAGSQLTVPVSAADADSPAQSLAFTLDAGAPAGATIDRATGMFSWAPAFFQAPDTNLVTIRVTDNGSPARSGVETIAITVSDVNRVVLVVGATNAAAGSQVLLPIQVKRFSNIANFQGSLHWDPSVATFLSVEQPGLANLNFGLGATSQGILTVSWLDPAGTAHTLSSGGSIAAVRFQLTSQPGMASVVWMNGMPTALKAGDASLSAVPVMALTGQITTAITGQGSPPVLSVAMGPGGGLFLSWQTTPGQTYRVQFAADLSSRVWSALGQDVVAQGNTAWALDVTGSTRQRFYRVLRLD